MAQSVFVSRSEEVMYYRFSRRACETLTPVEERMTRAAVLYLRNIGEANRSFEG
jgi:hypothetical protein